MDKKHQHLGMNPSTANGRLMRDIIYHQIKDTHNCFRCGQFMTRDTFSIEHKEPWLDSDDPKTLYFDMDNIAYSHLECNIRAARKLESPHSKEYLAKRNRMYKDRCARKKTVGG